MTGQNEITVLLKKDKETKNTVRFEEVHEATTVPVARNVYLSKPYFERLGKPDAITVTIQSATPPAP